MSALLILARGWRWPLAILLLALVFTTHAGAEGRPRLILTPAALENVRAERLRPGSHHARAFAELQRRVETGASAYDGRPGYRHAALAREAAMAWQVTRDPRYAQIAFETLRTSRREDEDQPDRGYGLSRAMMSVGYAFAYDGCHDAWTEPQRTEILGVMRAAAEAWPNFRHANVEAAHKGSNWVGVTRGGELLLHLAARGEPGYGPREDRIALCVADLARHIETAYGSSGWTQEGLGYLEYTLGFLAPAVYAAEQAGLGATLAGFRTRAWPQLIMGALSFRAGHDLLQSGVSGPRSSDEGMVSLLWPLVAEADRAAYRFFYDRHLGVRALRPTFDGRRAGTVWALLFHPGGVDETAPVPRPLFDAEKGAYFFRQRWQDADDILVSLIGRHDTHSHAWQQAETWQLGIMGYDTLFAGGPGKERDPALFSKLLINDRLERIPATGGARQLSAREEENGGGQVSLEAAGNFALAEARRTFAVAFPREGPFDAVIRIRDELANASAFRTTFQLRPEAGVRIETLPGTAGAPGGFVLHGRRGWLRGWVLAPAEFALRGGDTLRVEIAPAQRVGLEVVLALGTGVVPESAPE